MKFSAIFLLSIVLLGVAQSNAQNRFEDDIDGVSWSKTLRVRGVINRFDPFNETSLYRVSSNGNNNAISARADLVQFETIASGFWGVLRDSLEEALRAGKANVYTLGFPRNTGRSEIRVKRTKVTYEDLLDSLSLAFVNFTSANDRMTQIFDPSDNAPTSMARLVDRTRTQARGKRLITDFRLFSVFELELAISVDETGFKIKPVGLIFGTAHWGDEIYYNKDNLLSPDMFTGYDTSDPRNPKNLGFFVDLSEEKTLKWLIENGMQYSGERNLIPFYDLMTLFHYPYKIYAESNNVLAVGAFNFKDKYKLEELEKTLLDRYNDMMYMYLYGQAPEWWDQGKRGAFTNGMFEMDTVRKKSAEEAAKQPAAEAEPARRGGSSGGGSEPSGGAPAKTTTRRGGGGGGDSGTPAKTTTAKPAPAPAKDTPPATKSTRRRRGN